MYAELLQKASHLVVTEQNASLFQLDGNDIDDNADDRSFEDQTTHPCHSQPDDATCLDDEDDGGGGSSDDDDNDDCDDGSQSQPDDVTSHDDISRSNPNVTASRDTGTDDTFVKFYDWMLSPDGGLQHAKSAKQHVAQVKGVLSALQTCSISALWEKAVLEKFCKYASERKYLPGTSKSYLTSVKHFYGFMLSDSCSLSPSTVKQIRDMKDRVALWIASFRKDCARRQLEKMDSDINKLLSPEHLAQFRASQCALDAIKIIGICTDSSYVVSQADFVLVRDFLLTEISLGNANRSGVLANMTVGQFSQARIVDGSYVVSVTDHKTAYSYGPAKIVLSPSLHSWVNAYVEKLRSAIVSSLSPENLFLTWNGEALVSGQVTRAIQSIWKKAGLGSQITSNLVRKTAVTAVHQSKPDMSNKLADLMCHRVSTAQRCYRLVEREKSSVSASKTLSDMLTRSQPQRVDESGQADVSDQLPAEIHISDINSISATEDNSSVVGPSTCSSKDIFDNSDTKVITKLCGTMIAKGPISDERIQELLDQSSAGEKLLERFSIFQIKNRIKYERRKLMLKKCMTYR